VPTIAIVDGVVLMMYVNDHPPAHVHAKLAEHRCKISIVTGEVISGTLPSSKLKIVQSWLKAHREETTFAWDELQNSRSIEGMIK
jgi:Domain of unknown function (DUF4160)